MAELEAVFENEKNKTRNAWRHPLPLNEPRRLGRVPAQADWWMPDELISGHHATITWDGTALKVCERVPPPINRVYHNSEPVTEFSIAPGDSFVIGNTVFTLHGGSAGLSGPDAWADATQPAVAVASRKELRQFNFDAPAVTLRALEQIADVLRMATDEDVLFRAMLTVALNALPKADAAAIVLVPPESTDAQPRAVVREQMERMAIPGGERFTPSRRLADKAIRRVPGSIAYAWVKGLDDSSSMTVAAEVRGGTPWAVCTPFQDGSGMGLYVAGHLPKPPETRDGKLQDRELTDCQKVVELIASLIESTRKSHALERQLAVYGRFIPRRVRSETDREKLDAILAPRQTDVTVLFCDLRGSARFAENKSAALLDGWKLLSDAIDEMSSSITMFDGNVAGFQGDAVMAFWGWPDPQADQVERAAKVALRLRDRFATDGRFAHFSVGIGIATGSVIAGRLGSHDLAKVDVFGPTVNLASRLESMTKMFGTKILLDETSAAALLKVDPHRQSYRTRKLVPVCPAGMTVPVTPSELLPPENAPGLPMKESARRSWEEAMEWYVKGDWRRAKERLQQYFPKDPFALLLLGEISKTETLPQNWTGVLTLTTK